MSAEFVARMEDVLDLYAEPYDPQRPVVCFDETSKQLVAEKRAPIPAKAGRREALVNWVTGHRSSAGISGAGKGVWGVASG